MAEYTPSDELMRTAWHQYATAADAEYARLREDEDNPTHEFDRFLARVKREAAREALDGLAGELMEAARDCASDGDRSGAGAWRNASAHAHHYRDTHYPEVTR